MEFMQLNNYGIRKMVSIEPVMDFDSRDFLYMLQDIKPEFESIGADSKNNNLTELSSKKIKELIYHLKKITRVIIKNNLNRLLQ